MAECTATCSHEDDAVMTLSRAEAQAVRKALLIGLASFGEIERVRNEMDIAREIDGRSVPDGWRPLHPTGHAETVGQFADALMYVNAD